MRKERKLRKKKAGGTEPEEKKQRIAMQMLLTLKSDKLGKRREANKARWRRSRSSVRSMQSNSKSRRRWRRRGNIWLQERMPQSRRLGRTKGGNNEQDDNVVICTF